jgi:hypothetical protein
MALTIRQVFTVNGIPTDVESAVLSDPTGSYGMKRTDTEEIVVADGTAMVRVEAGTYEYEYNDAVGIPYVAYVEFQYGSTSYYVESEFAGRADTSSDSRMAITYRSLKERVGHYLFGIRSNFTVDQLADIDDCIVDGLQRVYAFHDWSFFRPVVDITTTAPYATGTIAVSSGVVTLTGGSFPSWAADGVLHINGISYPVASRTSSSVVTISNTSLTVAAGTSYKIGRPEVPMPAEFQSVANDSELAYYPDDIACYPSVVQRGDQVIRKFEQESRTFDRPVFYSVRTERFDPAVGSRKVLAFYPTPDKAYTMRVPMVLRQLMLTSDGQQPVGGEVLSQVITEACLASAEHNFEEREHVHEKRFLEMIALAVKNDLERSTPTSLGPDSPRVYRGKADGFGYDYRTREQRIGGLTLNGSDI